MIYSSLLRIGVFFIPSYAFATELIKAEEIDGTNEPTTDGTNEPTTDGSNDGTTAYPTWGATSGTTGYPTWGTGEPTPFDTSTSAPTTASPTPSQTAAPTVSSPQTGDECSGKDPLTALFQADIKFDYYAYGIEWWVYDVTDEDDKKEIATKKYKNRDSEKDVTEIVCLDPSKCYQFTIFDLYYNGLCCDYGYGNYKIYYEKKLIGEGAEWGGGDRDDYYEHSIYFGKGCVSSAPSDISTSMPSDAPTLSIPPTIPSSSTRTPSSSTRSPSSSTRSPSSSTRAPFFSTTAPTLELTESPTSFTTFEPTETPTAPPTKEPTATPTASPTFYPTESPTAEPTDAPTASPTEEPTAEPTDIPTDIPTTSPTGEPTDAPTMPPTTAPTVTPVCKYSRESKCIAQGCVWKKAKGKKEAMCEPCSAQKHQRICIKNGCLWTKARGTKPAVCESCADQKESKCLKKDCILVKKSDSPDKACTSCTSMSGKSGKCLTAKCAYDRKSKGCAPCSSLSRDSLCQKMKSCEWKPGKKGKTGRCGKVKGKVVMTCCDLYKEGTATFKNCCKSGIYGVCPLECPVFA